MKTKLMCFVMFVLGLASHPAMADLYMVTTSEGPGFGAPEEVVGVLENGILPTFAMLRDLQAKKKIITGGLPVGSRTLYLLVEASSLDEVDRMLRDLPAWGVFSWKVTPLQTLAARESMERGILKKLKSKK
ncbi:MAG: hypothetical protein HKN70_05535 [Gammaproteobacteria bacterium]|nr:hypothetical protein [Gammaproteobacteria bacterium]